MTRTIEVDRVAHLLALMKKGDDVFNSRDVAAMDAIHHPDMITYLPGAAEPILGRQAHAEMIEALMLIFPDIYVYNDPYPVQFGSGDWNTVITRTTGTFTGEWVLPNGHVIPPTGKAFDLNFSKVARWDGDMIIEEFVFWDSALQAQQIGLAG